MDKLQIYQNNGFDYQAEIRYISGKYQKYGMTADIVKSIADSGAEHGISRRARTIGVRMALAQVFNEMDYFSVEDVMEVTRESREEVMERMNQADVSPVTISVSPELIGG